MSKFSEAVKNFFKCAVLMLACGVCFIFALDKTTLGIVCIGVAVVLVIMAFSLAAKEKKEDKEK